MRDLAKEAYDACAVGAIGWMRPDPSLGETINIFQAVAQVSAPALQDAGLIIIQEMHRENQTGQRFVDAIKFVRLR